jgi:hypothetical protein
LIFKRELGLSKYISARSERLADIPDENIEKAEQKATEEGREFSTA